MTIQFLQVGKQFKKIQVLTDINLQIDAGNRVALVGSNGAGKTTLIRCLLGEYNCQGEVLVDGLMPRDNRQLVLRRIGFVPQLPPPLKMPVGQLLKFSASVCDADVSRMEEVAQRLGLDVDQIRQRPFVKLSGGQKQKLLISIALGRDTDILILDEPAANLDPEARHKFFQILAEKPKETVMLISSHRLDEVASLVNRVIEMDQGKIVLDDHVEELADMSSVLYVKISLIKSNQAFAKTIKTWGFEALADGRVWQGEIAGPDRLRFLGVITRYAGLLAGVTMDDKEISADV